MKMMNNYYLEESYGGESNNMLERSTYYCYTIYDSKLEMFYSGSRGVENSSNHDLLIKYFTSSTVIDFVKRLKENPEEFSYKIEYFKSREDAFLAEKIFHNIHSVGKNPFFLNSISSGGSNCGAGSVLCKDSDGNTYRVSIKEYANGNHKHISSGMMNIRTHDGIKRINKDAYDSKIHITEFKNYVVALDKITGKTCRIPKDKFESNDRYVGLTKGLVVAIDIATDKKIVITKDEFDNNKNKYVGNTYGLIPVIERLTNKKLMVKKEDFDKQSFRHFNEGKLTVYSLNDRKIVKITKDEYDKNSSLYSNLCTRYFFEVDGIFFKSKDLLHIYYKKTRGKGVLGLKSSEIELKFIDIHIITREGHMNGKN